MTIEDAEKLITDFLVDRVAPSVIYLFGSRVAGRARSNSDYDIAYLSDKHLSNYERFMLAQELAAILNRDVDLVDLKQASTVFQTEIIETGKVLYGDHSTDKALFEMRALKNYAILNEERRVILENISERGQIYEE
ncbi:type VII toxin-antitoxin system MntA family adenylyltransferase antitoxin [Bacillus badius]|uniref:Polymerase beta nucleotidyltransferase domain-containing protein n=1 Tax=Bacillus badius TaxID=1455 RepID=A0ABR5ARP8_BACBA|nr:nucleotidyltransferase domain-containing protein [Bacillus badius]KIL74000.1 hypothetical protein SD78_3058 [Bacillus badius]KIL77417.1 hypothetical protein SD77_1403 [Bacillus badius]TDW01442.1 putative nucleotidyltransferase [Bacillus badius]UAT32843.1 nucleotidyltransferase domain-containing protein [Bacillus badius]GLY11861.1 toxin-antitoxin system antidote Mnt family protein [Bacillus badius]